jgi:hypothetical protein
MGVPGDRRMLITDRQATAEVIRTAAEWLIAHSSPEATVVFFYAGHVRKVGGGREAIVASDGQLVSDADLGERFTRLRAGHAWFGIAACYGGGFTELMGPNRILTAAAPANSLAYENLDFGRSYMVEYMVRRGWIAGHAGLTVEEGFEFARDSLSRDHPRRVPVQFDNVDGLLDLRPPEIRSQPSRPASPPPPPPPAGSEPDDNGGSGSNESPPTTKPPEDDKDSCQSLTVGVVRCGG